MSTTRTDAASLWRSTFIRASSTSQAGRGVPLSAVKRLDMSGVKIVSIADNPELRDRLATIWLDMLAAQERLATEVPDNAPQNTYATVTVNGKVVANLYNGGSCAMTNAAAAQVGTWQDPPGLFGGPDLAQWRAELIAKAVGGKIEKAPTAIRQSEWTPRQTASPQYTRAQLDVAIRAMMDNGREAAAQRIADYQTSQDVSGALANVEA
jgi:hypothetical protein